MKKKYTGGVNVGTSSILVTFVLLCLVTFAALSFLSANSDYKLSQQTAKRTTDYYAANQTAEYYMADVESKLVECRSRNDNFNSYVSELPSLFDINDFSVTVSDDPDDKILINYDVSVNDTQNLHVCLSVCDPYDKTNVETDALFHIVSWQTVNKPVSDEGAVTLDDDGIGFMTFD